MEKKKSFAQRMETFFAGKGFYIVLALCVTVIGLSVWSMLAPGSGNVNGPDDAAMAVSRLDDTTVSANAPASATPTPVATAMPKPSAPPTATPTPTPTSSAAPTVTIPEEPLPAESDSFFIWPVTGEIERPYSVETLVYDPTMRDWRTHDGVDIAAELGSSVRAVTDGQVTEIFDDPMLGTTVVLSHRNGLVSVYANLAALPTVQVGDLVCTGQILGAVGDTALCETGEVCHLHFAMALDGISTDPTEQLP